MCSNIILKESNTMWHVLTWFGNLFQFSLSLWSHLVFFFFFFLHLEKRLSGEKCSGIFKGSLHPGLHSSLLCLSRKKKVLSKPPWERRRFVSEGNPEKRFASKHSHRSIFSGVSSLSRKLSAQCWVEERNIWSHENRDHSSGNPGWLIKAKQKISWSWTT